MVNLITPAANVTDISQAYWGAQAVTFGAATISPDGTTDGHSMIETAAAGFHDISHSVGKAASSLVYSFGCYASLGSGTRFLALVIGDSSGNNVNVVFNLSNGSIAQAAGPGGTGWSGGTATITQKGPAGWYLVKLENVTSDATVNLAPAALMQAVAGTGSYTGDGTSSIRLTQMTLCQASTLDALPLLTQSITLTVDDISSLPLASLSNLHWAWWDGIDLAVVGAPSSQGSTGSTDTSATLTLNLPNSTLSSGQSGMLGMHDASWSPGRSWLITKTTN